MNYVKKIIIVIIVTFFLIAIAFFASCADQRADMFVSNAIYFLTLVAIIWYSYETKLLREITHGRPVISIIKNVSDTIEIRNDGSNIAYNVIIYFLYDGKTARDNIKIAVLGKGLFYRVGISNKEIDKGNGEKVKLSELINISPPDKHLKVIVDYSDSIENEGQFRDKWKLDETVIMSSANEGRFRMIYSDNKKK